MMIIQSRRFALASAMLLFGFGGGGRAVAADINISTPDGLTAGQSFRIVFVTDGTRDATSSNIGDYNTFVTSDAITEAGGGSNAVKYMGVTLTWTAIASTPSTDAITNVGENPNQSIPIYLASGERITPADNTNGLWSGSLLAGINEDLRGQQPPKVNVYTGSNPDGTRAGLDTLGPTLGRANVGEWGANDSRWVFVDAINPTLNESFYGISQVITVPSTVPEPSSIWMVVGGICVGVAYRWSRRRRHHRRQFPVGQPQQPTG